MRPWVLLSFALALSCRTPTQITVKLRGVGLQCKGGEPPAVVDTGIAAKDRFSAIEAATVIGERCDPVSGAENDDKDLGDVVLVPSGGSDNAEVLAVTAITLPNADGASADECIALYVAEQCVDGACDACIIARRSIQFVEHSKLEVRIEFEPSCAGVICDSTKTCSKGKCISADTECPPEGCGLVEGGSGPGGGGNGGNGGGAGAGGAGAGGAGAGGAGGTGGSGGSPVIWTQVTDQPAEDLVGIGVNASFELYIAASDRMLKLDAAGLTAPYPQAPTLTFMAVAEAEGEAVSYGNAGGRLGVDDFAEGPFSYNPTLGPGDRWDVAYQPDMTSVLPFHFLEGSLAGGGDTSADSGPMNPLEGAIFTTVSGSSSATFFAYNTPADGAGASLGRGTLAFSVGSASEWNLWGYADPTDHYCLMIGGDTDRVYVYEGVALSSALSLNAAQPLSVTAVWGIEPQVAGTTTDLFVAGPASNGNSTWVGRTKFSALATEYFSPTLQVVEGPPGTDIRSIWAGRADGAPKVFVAGSGGVFSALVSSFPTP